MQENALTYAYMYKLKQNETNAWFKGFLHHPARKWIMCILQFQEHDAWADSCICQYNWYWL